jgi:hypothetical protein
MGLRQVYSTRLLAWAADSSPAPFEVPTGYTCVVRDADVWSGGGAMIDYQLAINTVAKFWAGQFTVESLAQVAQWRGRQVLNAGELLVFSSSGATDGLVSGYLLLDP